MTDQEFIQRYAEAPRNLQKSGGRIFQRVKTITLKHFNKHPTPAWFISIDRWIWLAWEFTEEAAKAGTA